MTSQFEKLFLHYTMENPVQMERVLPLFYDNKEIRFVYEIIKEEYDKSKKNIVPNAHEIYQLVRLKDPTATKIADGVLKAVLTPDKANYRIDFVKPKFDSWVLERDLRNGIDQSIDLLREIKPGTDNESIIDVADKIRELINKVSSPSYEDTDMGIDFDNPEAHNQETYANKIPTGYTYLDNLMGGGFDVKTLNALCAESNAGKSMWMQNIATNVANAGYNVLYVSLEMSEKKVVKRIGSMRLGIPIRDYDELSKDTEYIRDQLDKLKKTVGGGQDLFEAKLGKIYIKEFPCNTLTPLALDAYIDRLEKLTGNKIHLLVIDYLTIMTTERRLAIENNLYMRGKNLAEGIRGIAQKRSLAALTATQLSKDKWGANDIELKDVPESKAIVETADTMFGIIRNPVMKVNKLYQLKALKLRDAEFIYDRIQYTFDTDYLRINEQQIINDNNL